LSDTESRTSQQLGLLRDIRKTSIPFQIRAAPPNLRKFSGRAAQLLGKDREECIRHASQQGIPYSQLDSDELQRELDTFKKL
jgi:hypothetical protein